ncbi:OmpA family protein [Compostibacter hankyongensis]|uniref:OmpA family protein n=1 Tax=Compostibacter hankyongensis TaxID=1007089 RepID=UPI0031E75D25
MTNRTKHRNSIVALGLAAVVLFGCGQPLTRTQKGAMIGTGAGAATGAIVGKVAGNTALGAIIGAAVGGTAGVLIGKKMDKQAKEIQQELPNAQVERQGEGIIVTFNSSVLFGFDKSDLTDASKATIGDLNTILQKYPDENVMIIGHTDDKGTDAYNQGLSERRASSVAAYLRTLGVSSSRITTKGMGESDPKVPNDSEANRAENRRVEFVLTANEKMKQEARQEAQQ